MSEALRSTAIHEAGHAVALIRLFGDLNGRINSLRIKDNGEGVFDVVHLDEFTQENCRREAIVYYSGWAAVLAFGFSEAEAERGTDPDFAEARAYSSEPEDELKAEARNLVEHPRNIHCIQVLGDALLQRRILEGNCIRDTFLRADDSFAG